MPAVNNGFLFDDDGSLEVSGGPIVNWNGGLPFDADGKLVGVAGDPPAGTPFVGGVAVSSTVGVFVLGATPADTSGFSNGFDGGFD